MRRLRQENGYKQVDVAVRSGMSRQEISMLECCDKLPDWETIDALAGAFEMEDWEFVKLCNERRKESEVSLQVAEKKPKNPER